MLKYIIIFFIDLLLLFFAPTSMERTYMGFVLIVVVLSILCFINDKSDNLVRKIKKQYLRHSVFFILCFSIVFFQCDLDYVLGIIDDSNRYLWVNPSVVCRSLCISNLALICLIIGYRFNIKRINHNNYRNQLTIISTYDCSNKKIVAHGVFLALVIYVILVPKQYFIGGYGSGVDSGNIEMILSYLQAGYIAMFTLYCTDFVKYNFRNWGKYFRYPLILSFIFIALVFLSGRRTEAIRIACIVLISYLFCKQNMVNYKKIFVWGAICVLSVSVLAVLRTLPSGTLVDSMKLVSQLQSISPFTQEYAMSVNTLHIATTYYPDSYDYNYGTTFIPGFFKLFPGLFSFYMNFFVGGEYLHPSMIFTKLYFTGDIPFGIGSSILADIYISFGILGICLVFFLLGYFFKYLEYNTFYRLNSPYALSLSFSAYSAFLYACRASVDQLFLCWTYSCLIIYLASSFRKINRRESL